MATKTATVAQPDANDAREEGPDDRCGAEDACQQAERMQRVDRMRPCDQRLRCLLHLRHSRRSRRRRLCDAGWVSKAKEAACYIAERDL